MLRKDLSALMTRMQLNLGHSKLIRLYPFQNEEIPVHVVMYIVSEMMSIYYGTQMIQTVGFKRLFDFATSQYVMGGKLDREKRDSLV